MMPRMKKIAFKPGETLVMCKPFCRHFNSSAACGGALRRNFQDFFIHRHGYPFNLVIEKD
jgi:hypothetical protein